MARILIIADTYPPNRGGSETSLEIIAEGLARQGHRVIVFTPAVRIRNERDKNTANARVHRSRVWLTLQELSGHKSALVNRLSRLLILPFLATRLFWLKIDIVIAGHIIPAGAVGIFLMRLKRCRAMLVITYGEEITIYRRGSRMLNLMQKILGKAHVVTVLTESSKTELEEVLPGTAFKTEVVPPAVITARQYDPASVSKMAGSPVLFTLSRLVERKGIDTAIKAVGLLKNELPNLRYYIAGSGPYKQHLINLAQTLELQDHVYFLGNVDNADGLYIQCDIFCMPNRQLADGEREGFGIVFLEAGLRGKPSIAGRSGGAVDAVIHEVTGLVVTPDDPAATAEAIRNLALNPDYRSKLGCAAKLHAENFTPDRMADAYGAIIQRL